MTPRLSPRTAALALLTLGLVACGDGSGDDAPPLTGDAAAPADGDELVRVVDNAFEPDHLEVEPGTTVVWQWEGRAPHDVAGNGFASEVLREGSFAYTFDEPGTYDYVCTLHPGMEGRVEVADA